MSDGFAGRMSGVPTVSKVVGCVPSVLEGCQISPLARCGGRLGGLLE